MNSNRTLSDLTVGSEAILGESASVANDEAILRAMGLNPGERVRIARQGEPCIVIVRGMRIGLSKELSCRVKVLPAI